MASHIPDSIDEKHLYSSAQKLEWWGYGEWVEEPDYASFEVSGYRCLVTRQMIPEDSEATYVSGGYLCGYVAVPYDHPWALNEEILGEGDVHGGITFTDGADDEWVLGFDCAHSSDVVPSVPLKKINLKNLFGPNLTDQHLEQLDMFAEIMPREYRNMEFCIEECVKLAIQAHQVEKQVINV